MESHFHILLLLCLSFFAYCQTECPSDCSSHGICHKGICFCDPFHHGNDCSIPNVRRKIHRQPHLPTPSSSSSDSPTSSTHQLLFKSICVDDKNLNYNCFHGQCFNNTCHCQYNWGGPKCDQPLCIDLLGCGPHGECDKNQRCQCENGYKGPTCNIEICPQNCTYPNGECLNDKCQCNRHWKGDGCNEPICPNQCNLHGRCIVHNGHSFCQCQTGYNGDTCEIPLCLNDCNNNGECINPGQCDCYDYYEGDTCEISLCPNMCSEHGECDKNRGCLCIEGYAGDDCSIKIGCDGKCHPSRGTCVVNTCTCLPAYQGVYCQEHICPHNCHSHGKCVDGTCECFEFFSGMYCETYEEEKHHETCRHKCRIPYLDQSKEQCLIQCLNNK